jgi:hypothetical protein
VTQTLRTALVGAVAVGAFAVSMWVANEPAIAQDGGAPAAQGGRGRGRGRGPTDPAPRLADGTVNLGRVPGEKGTWRVPYITNMAMRLVGADGQVLPEIVKAQQAQQVAAAAARAGGAGRAGAGGGGGGRGGS